MLEQILRHLNNWFLVGIHKGEFAVEKGGIALPFLQENQYFRIVGSVFNDGLYQYPCSALIDETFNGAIWALAVPKTVLDLAEDISKWQEKNGDAAASPFTSESFGGYSYSKGSVNSNGSGVVSWQSVFKSRLDTWRRTGGIL